MERPKERAKQRPNECTSQHPRLTPTRSLRQDDGHAGTFLLWPPGTHSRYLLFADSVVAASESGRRLRELGGRADSFLVMTTDQLSSLFSSPERWDP